MKATAPTIRERMRERFRLTAVQAAFAWRQVTEKESGTASYVAALEELGRATKSPHVQASNALRNPKVKDAMAWLREELGIAAQEREEEFTAAQQRADTIRFLRWACGASPAKVLADGFVLDETAWLALPEDVRDLVTEVEIEPVKLNDGSVRGVIKKFKVLDRMKAQAMLMDLFGLKAPQKLDQDVLDLLGKLAAAAMAEKARRAR